VHQKRHTFYALFFALLTVQKHDFAAKNRASHALTQEKTDVDLRAETYGKLVKKIRGIILTSKLQYNEKAMKNGQQEKSK
ncbi:hypothetical protein KAZ92_03095, partial [Candidatus Gracilibacteria bacterium]|nr:hypothetical protein [Candidatus Gracilibacteria bacterium]